MATEIANLEPIRMDGRTYVDVRTLHHPDATPRQAEQGRQAAGYMRFSLRSVPQELICDEKTRRPKSRVGRGSTFDMSEDEMLGDVLPISLATFDGTHCLGVFCLYGIRIVASGARFYRVVCRVVPSSTQFVLERSHQRWAEAFADLLEFLSDRSFPLVDGKRLEIQEAGTAVHYLEDTTDADTRLRLFLAEVTRRATGHPTHRIERSRYRSEDRDGWFLVSLRGK